MPQIGQKPGASRTICGCMGQVYSTAPPAGGGRRVGLERSQASAISTGRAARSPPAARHYCAGTYVGSRLALSMIEPYAVTRPVPLTTSTLTRALYVL